MCIQAGLPDPSESAEAIMALEDNNEHEAVQPLAEGRALFHQGQRIRERLVDRIL